MDQTTLLREIADELEPSGIRCHALDGKLTCTTGRGNTASVTLHPKIGECGTVVVTLLWFDQREQAIQYPASQTALVADVIIDHMNDGVL